MKLYNEDCLKVINKIDISKIIIVSDPPFNMDYHYNTYSDDKPEDEYYSWLGSIFSLCPSVVIHYPESLHRLSIEMKKVPKRIISWVYNSNTARQHRDIAFYDIIPNFNEIKQPYKNPNDKRIQERISRGLSGCKLYDWWNVNQVKNVSKDKTFHPCQMPLEVMMNVVGIIPKGFTVFDPFMGSGTTGVACKSFGIDFIGCEIDNVYFEIAKKRIEDGIDIKSVSSNKLFKRRKKLFDFNVKE